MSRKMIITLCVVAVFFSVSITSKYYKYFIQRDFDVSAEVPCDTTLESCFVWDCDTTDEECDQEPYKYLYFYANDVPRCDPYKESCPALSCDTVTGDCEETLCQPDTVGDDEYCVGPVI